jgi:hypothetical protein
MTEDNNYNFEAQLFDAESIIEASKDSVDDILARRIENKGNLQDQDERKKYAIYTFRLVAFYVFTILLITISCGLEWLKLSDTVILALLGGSLAQIIGLFAFVMKYLFPNKGYKNDNNSNSES